MPLKVRGALNFESPCKLTLNSCRSISIRGTVQDNA